MSDFCWRFLLLFLLGFTSSVGAQNLHLTVLGSSDTETKILDSLQYQKRFTNYSDLQKEVDSVLSISQKKGYYDLDYAGLQKLNDSGYVANIQLNNKYKWIRIYDENLLGREMVRKQFRLGGEDYLQVRVEAIEPTLNKLANLAATEGDPFFKLSLVNISKISEDILEASLRSQENGTRKIDKIVVKGYEDFPKSFLQYYLRIKPGETFDLNRIKLKSRSLQNLRFANNQKDPEVLFTTDSTLLYIYVEKIPSNNFDGFIGFGTNESTGKLQFDGYLNLELLNNLNFGESLELYYKSDESDQRTFDVKVELPFLFRSPVGLRAQLNIFKKDTTFLSSTQKGALVYQINNKHQLAGGLTYLRSDLLEATVNTSLNDFNSLLYNVEYVFNELSENNVLFPVKSRFELLTEIGSRESFEKSVGQTKFHLETFRIFELNFENNLYGRITGGYLISNDYLVNELFRFGGINSIRGFKENILIANLYGVLNTEYRYILNPNLYVHTVLDFGYLENTLSSQKEKLLGFGLGFGLLTSAGLLKLNYSGSKADNQNIKLSDFKIHISLNARF